MRESAYKVSLGYKHRRTDVAVNLLFLGIVCVATVKLHFSALPPRGWQLAGLWTLQVWPTRFSLSVHDRATQNPNSWPGIDASAVAGLGCIPGIGIDSSSFPALLGASEGTAADRSPAVPDLAVQVRSPGSGPAPSARVPPQSRCLCTRVCTDTHTACARCLHRHVLPVWAP